MTSEQAIGLVRVGLCCLAALFIGYCVAMGKYLALFVLFGAVIAGAVIVAEGFSALLAFGLLCPFVLPVPFVRGFPMMATVIGLCVVKLILLRSLLKEKTPYAGHAVTYTSGAFLVWVMIRYAMDPVLPNVQGIGQHVSGFRAYFSYAICFAAILFMGGWLTSRRDFKRLLYWLGMLSVCLVAILAPLVVFGRGGVAEFLSRLGMFVTVFDNGMLRFVVLPGYGIVLVMLAMMPGLLNLRPNFRMAALAIGGAAIILGGSRSSLLAAFIMVLCVALVRWPKIRVAALCTGIVVVLGLFHVIGENVPMRKVGLLRVLSITSSNVASQTDAMQNVEWRLKRWKRAAEDVEQGPLFGKGYGGLQNAWVFQTRADYEEASIDIDLAAGSIHNGFLAGARALGIPACVLFIVMLGMQCWVNYREARRLKAIDPFYSDLHCYVFAALTGQGIMIFFGSDLNEPWTWFHLGMGTLAVQVRRRELGRGVPEDAEEEKAEVALGTAPAVAVS